MDAQYLMQKFATPLFLIALTGATLSCSQQTGPRTWIDFPLGGSAVQVGAPVPVLAHAYSPDGVAEMVLSVNGQAYRRSPPSKPGQVFTDANLEWFPEREGDYLLQVTAYSKKGEAVHASSVTVKAIGKATATPVAATPVVITPGVVTPVAGASDLEIVSVESVIAGYKGATPFCDIRVVYRNAGTVPVPSDYVIQASLDGRPFAAMTRGAGFGVSGISEATFAYQFTGSAYIGINLDSTNAVAEGNEGNNAFAEIRSCGVSTVPITATLPPTPTRTPTLITPSLPVGCVGAPSISSFSASPATISQGQSATLNWGAVTNADTVSIEPGIGGVGAPGSASVSPATTTTYTLVARCGGNTTTRQTTVNVTIPPSITPTRTKTPIPLDTSPPPVPNPQDPTGGRSVSCSGATGSATLRWSSVSDPNGVHYYVKWSGGGQSGGWDGTGTSHGISIKCGYQYTWQVRACDLKGNCSNWSGSASFLAGTLQ